MVEHLPYHLRVEGSNPATVKDTWREKTSLKILFISKRAKFCLARKVMHVLVLYLFYDMNIVNVAFVRVF
jgi:hypothetical protein